MNKMIGCAFSGMLLVLLHGAALAAEPAPAGKPGKMMEEADANKDGKVSFDEFKAGHDRRMQEHFKKLDANGDGFIDKPEAQKGREEMREKRQDRMEKRQERMDSRAEKTN